MELGELIAHETYVVSASHFLLSLDEKVRPYDVDLRGLPLAVRKDWGEKIADAIIARTLSSTPKLDVTILAGEVYAQPIVWAIHRARNNGSPRWTEPHDLLHGKQVGERLHELNRLLKIAKGEPRCTSPS